MRLARFVRPVGLAHLALRYKVQVKPCGYNSPQGPLLETGGREARPAYLAPLAYRARLSMTVPDASRSSIASGILPSACVAQLRQGS